MKKELDDKLDELLIAGVIGATFVFLAVAAACTHVKWLKWLVR